MDKQDWIMLVTAAVWAVVALGLFANWHRKRLLRWCLAEVQYLNREHEAIMRERKLLTERCTWDQWRAHPGNKLLVALHDKRCEEYNARRQRLTKTTYLLPKLLPW